MTDLALLLLQLRLDLRLRQERQRAPADAELACGGCSPLLRQGNTLRWLRVVTPHDE